MTNRQLYMEKRKEVHTPVEVVSAFEDNTAIVLMLKKSVEYWESVICLPATCSDLEEE